MDMKDINQLRSEFEELQKQQNIACDDGSCVEDEYEDYPDYLKAIYAEIMPPQKSGIYFSRWDLKKMASELDESFSIDVRERMFQKFMQWIATPEDMKAVIGTFKKLIDMKCDVYRDFSERYSASAPIFDIKIQKAEKAKKYLDRVYVEFFTENYQ